MKANILDVARAVGAFVMPCTLTAVNEASAYELIGRPALNAPIRGDTDYPDIIDFPGVDAALDSWSSTYWSDALHPIGLGEDKMAAVALAAITPFVTP